MSKTRSSYAVACESFTGCRERRTGLGYPIAHGVTTTFQRAMDCFLDGETISFIEAGAGSYIAILERFGFSEIELDDMTSSAGDWSIIAFRGELYWRIFQENRAPAGRGFSYTLDTMTGCEHKMELF